MELTKETAHTLILLTHCNQLLKCSADYQQNKQDCHSVTLTVKKAPLIQINSAYSVEGGVNSQLFMSKNVIHLFKSTTETENATEDQTETASDCI